MNWIRQLIKAGITYNIDILESFDGPEPLNDAEVEWIAAARSCGINLTNATNGGCGCYGRQISKETRSRMSDSQRRRPPASRETRQKISNANKGMWVGRPLTDETKRKISTSKMGRRHTETTKLKMSKIHSGRRLQPLPIDRKRKIAFALGCRPFTDEMGNVYQTQREAAQAHGIDNRLVSAVLRGCTLSTHGHRFKYMEQSA